MLEEFGYLPPETKGIFRLADNGGESEREFKERAKRLRLTKRISRLEEGEARRALGPFFHPYFIHYLVPDTPFDEAYLLSMARHRAKTLNIYLRRAEITLIKKPETSGGLVIQVGDKDVIESRYTVLCAGAGLPVLLDGLGVTHPLAVFRSALLRVARGNVMRVPMLVDISEDMPSSGLSVIQHSPDVVEPNGCLVIGSKDRVRLKPGEVSTREVSRQEDENLQQYIPPILLPLERGVELRVEAGHKTEACDAHGNPSVAHWIDTWSEHPGLVAAVPGKATQALFVAEEIINTLRPQEDEPESETPPEAGPTLGTPLALPPPPGESSDYEPLMHHDQIFDGLLDEVVK